MYPNFEEFKKIAKTARMVPVYEELFLDTQTPIGIFLRYADDENSFLLESVEGGERWTRYSFIARRPFMTFKSSGDDITITKDEKTTVKKGNPFKELKALLNDYKGISLKGMPRFCGGAVGYIGYDMVRHIEYLPDTPEDDIRLPDSYLAFYDEVVAYDHLKQRVMVIVNVDTAGDIEKNYEIARQRIEITADELITPYKYIKPIKAVSFDEIKMESNFTKNEFMLNVDKAKEYIRNGDIFQVVLSQRFAIETDINPLRVYRVLRTLNPSPYLYYLKFGDAIIVGSSPELMVRVENGIVETCPIAGTSRRGKDKDEDELLAKKLLKDEKEMAEHTMLVDLGRNDLGKISKFGSVKVLNPMHIEKYSKVMHIVSNVQGELDDDKDCFDALTAVLPAGTLSGAPKVRAMQIIDELEPVKRGIYGGCVGYMGFDGNLDTCIAIRTIVFNKGKAYIQAGAGIVADSVPENEYEETLNKGHALFASLREAGDI
ncbi:MAG: anthranilate synthase component I [Eubacteriales bacterium]